MTIRNASQAPDARARWRKSSYSGSGNNCVEVAQAGGTSAVRDSKDPDGGHLVFDGDPADFRSSPVVNTLLVGS